MRQEFSFGDAFMYFVRAEADGRWFLPKYWVSFVIGFGLALTFVCWLSWNVISGVFSYLFMRYQPGNSASDLEIVLFFFLLVPITMLVMWAIFEASILRRLVRGEGFKLRFGSDELRLLPIGLFWFGFLIAYFIYLGAVMNNGLGDLAYDLGGYRNGDWLIALFWFLASAPWIYPAIKLSPAGAATIRDRKVRLFGAWRATKGRYWRMFWAFALWLIGGLVLYVIVIFGVAVLLDQLVWGRANMFDVGGQISPFDQQTAYIISFITYICCLSGVLGLLLYLYAGPAALAAKTDPNAFILDEAQLNAFD